MKIQPVQNIQQPRGKICQKVQKAIAKGKSKWNKIVADVYVRHGYYWDENCKEWKRERDLPSCITRPSEYDGIVWGKTIFTPEDIEKMLSMNKEERYLYMRKLIEEGKYTEEWPE